jgi:hypothetical protein
MTVAPRPPRRFAVGRRETAKKASLSIPGVLQASDLTDRSTKLPISLYGPHANCVDAADDFREYPDVRPVVSPSPAAQARRTVPSSDTMIAR